MSNTYGYKSDSYQSFLDAPIRNRADVIYEYTQRAQREQNAYTTQAANAAKKSSCHPILGFGCGSSGFAQAISGAVSGFISGGPIGAAVGYAAGGDTPVGSMSNNGGGGLFSGSINLGQLFKLPKSTPPFVGGNSGGGVRPAQPVTPNYGDIFTV